MLTSVRLDEKSPTACAQTSWRDRIHRLEEARTVHAPAICSVQGVVLLAWTGTDAHPALP